MWWRRWRGSKDFFATDRTDGSKLGGKSYSRLLSTGQPTGGRLVEQVPHGLSTTYYLVRGQGACVDECGEESALFDLRIFAVNEQT